MAVSVIAACLAALLPAVADAGTPPGPRSDTPLQQQLDDLVRAPGGPPGAIAVLSDRGHLRVVRAGVADPESGRRPDLDDRMRLAGAAEAFSGAVALSLVDRGALRLEDTIGERLPRLPRAWGAVTLRQLLSHTSGLPDSPQGAASPEILLTDQPLRFPPGTRYQYSASDHLAVTLMAEAATGTPYERLLRDLVHRPLGLSMTDVGAPEGIVSTPADMARFIRDYAGGRLYGPDVVREQRRWSPGGASEPAGPGRNDAGLALFRYTTRCGVVLGHTGNTVGSTQLIAATPDGRRSLTFSVTAQINQAQQPELLSRLRAVEENAVCALLRRRS